MRGVQARRGAGGRRRGAARQRGAGAAARRGAARGRHRDGAEERDWVQGGAEVSPATLEKAVRQEHRCREPRERHHADVRVGCAARARLSEDWRGRGAVRRKS